MAKHVTKSSPRLKVRILDPNNLTVLKLFQEWDFEIAPSIKTADLVVWTGGPDIAPEIYHQRRVSQVGYVQKERDQREIVAYLLASKKPKVGICRGAQLLNLCNGGLLWQHVDRHTEQHMLITKSDRIMPVTSTHHQMMRPGPESEVLAWAYNPLETRYGLSTVRADGNGISRSPDKSWNDPEVVWYPKTKSLCIQGHPEYAAYARDRNTDHTFKNYCRELIMERVVS